MEKWEHMVLVSPDWAGGAQQKLKFYSAGSWSSTNDPATPDGIIDRLDNAGAQGWQLVQVQTHGAATWFWLKRRVQ
jgi:hypothetical protein